MSTHDGGARVGGASCHTPHDSVALAVGARSSAAGAQRHGVAQGMPSGRRGWRAARRGVRSLAATPSPLLTPPRRRTRPHRA